MFSLSPWSGQILAGFPVPRDTWDTSRVLWVFVYRTFTFYGVPFQTLLLTLYNPTLRSRNPLYLAVKSLGFSLFARRYWGNPLRFLFLRLLRCFSSPRSPLAPMYSVQDILPLGRMGCPIRKSPDQSLFAAPRSISLLTTSFIALVYLAIHHKLLVAWPLIYLGINDLTLHYIIVKERNLSSKR